MSLSKIATAALLSGATLLPSAGNAQEPSRAIVLLHGATMDASSWRGVHDILKAKGFMVVSVQLPLTNLEADVTAVELAIRRLDGPVVLVGHSYGGAVASVAGRDPKVRSLVYVAALQPDAGESVADLASRWPMPSHALDLGDGTMVVDPDHYRADVAGDLSVEDAAFMAASQKPTAFGVFTVKMPGVAWHDKPSHGIVATLDRTLSPDLERFMYARSKAKVVEIEASHVPHMSHPDAVVKVIVEAAAAD